MACHGLTSDIVFEILTRASPETARTCRLVSREWNGIFTDLHPHPPRIKGFFLQRPRIGDGRHSFVPLNGTCPDLPLSFLGRMEKSAKIFASHRGILVGVSEDAYRWPYVRWLVCKPSTKEWTEIPNPKTKGRTRVCAMVVIRSAPKVHYKILRVSQYRLCAIVYEIFDSEAGRWKRLSINNSVDQHDFVEDRQVVVGGTAFWLDKDHHTIFSFDMYKETRGKFTVTVPVPDLEVQSYSVPRLVSMGGKLGLLAPTYCGEFMDLWVMENPLTRVWEKRKRISIHETGSEFPLALRGTDVALFEDFHKAMACRVLQPSTAQVFKKEYKYRIFPYRSDLEVGTLR